MKRSSLSLWLASAVLGAAGAAFAQQQAEPAPAPAPATAAAAPGDSMAGGSMEGMSMTGDPAADAMVLLFDVGTAKLGPENEAMLDKASRMYRESRPVIMAIVGSSDTTGSPTRNLMLSQARANAVAQGLVARGIPAEQTQIVAKGVTRLPVPTGPGVAEPRNRRVEILCYYR